MQTGTHLEDSRMRQEGLVVGDRQPLEGLVHVDGLPGVVERARLPLLNVAQQRHALNESVVPRKVRIECEQGIDESLRNKK